MLGTRLLTVGQMEGTEEKQKCVVHFKTGNGVLAGKSHFCPKHKFCPQGPNSPSPVG